jgi:hypothetical protein
LMREGGGGETPPPLPLPLLRPAVDRKTDAALPPLDGTRGAAPGERSGGTCAAARREGTGDVSVLDDDEVAPAFCKDTTGTAGLNSDRALLLEDSSRASASRDGR